MIVHRPQVMSSLADTSSVRATDPQIAERHRMIAVRPDREITYQVWIGALDRMNTRDPTRAFAIRCRHSRSGRARQPIAAAGTSRDRWSPHVLDRAGTSRYRRDRHQGALRRTLNLIFRHEVPISATPNDAEQTLHTHAAFVLEVADSRASPRGLAPPERVSVLALAAREVRS